MAKGINKVILVGHAGQDTEIRYTQAGVACASASIATGSVRKNKATGEREEHTEWHRVTAFNRLAEIFDTYVKKGQQVYIEGFLRTKKWTDQGGVDRYTTEVIANEMQLLGVKDGTPRQEQRRPTPTVSTASATPQAQNNPSTEYGGATRENANGTQKSPHATPIAAPYDPSATQNFAYDDDIPF